MGIVKDREKIPQDWKILRANAKKTAVDNSGVLGIQLCTVGLMIEKCASFLFIKAAVSASVLQWYFISQVFVQSPETGQYHDAKANEQ